MAPRNPKTYEQLEAELVRVKAQNKKLREKVKNLQEFIDDFAQPRRIDADPWLRIKPITISFPDRNT